MKVWEEMDNHISPEKKNQNFAFSHLPITVKRLDFFSHENSSEHQFLSKFVVV